MIKTKFNTTKYFEITGFTLAETLITLVIIGVIAAVTVPILLAKYNEEQTVSKVKKAYSTIGQAWKSFQIENSCTGSVASCFESGEDYCNMIFYNRILKHFNTVDKIAPNTTTSSIEWLPKKAYNINGSEINRYWVGVHRNTGSSCSAYATLTDGMIIHIHMPDTTKQSGLVFIDTNGAKKPNRIGKDQFPIGIGARNHEKYKNSIHPFYNEDDTSGQFFNGLCDIANNHECDADTCTSSNCSPTAYVLKYNKLPHMNW